MKDLSRQTAWALFFREQVSESLLGIFHFGKWIIYERLKGIVVNLPRCLKAPPSGESHPSPKASAEGDEPLLCWESGAGQLQHKCGCLKWQ